MVGDTDNLTLADLLRDPLIHLMMRSDGIDQSSIEALFARLAQTRRQMPGPGSW